MSKDCNKSSCEGCSESNCSERKIDFYELPNKLSNIKKVVSIMSGKGGVGKSLVTTSLAVSLAKKGYKVGILDADITGPSIPKSFGIKDKAMANEDGAFPIETKKLGIKVMSVNVILDDEEAPVIWRGPILGNAVKQFWTDIIWGDIDVLLIDMPPGTGDVPLTVFQIIPLDGTIMVTSPQELVSLIVKKSYNMAQKMNINILGVVENMSYMECPDCKKKIYPFGESNIEQTAYDLNIDLLAKLPINPEIAKLCDEGKAEELPTEKMDYMTDVIINKLNI